MDAVDKRAPTVVAFVEIILVAASLRAVITAVGPLVAEIRDSLDLSNAAVGVLTTMPLIAFAAFSTPAATLAARFGADRVLAGAMALLTAGVLIRSGGTAAAAVAGTAMLGAGIAVGNVLLPGVVRRAFPHRSGSMTSVYVTVMAAFAGLGAAVSVPLAGEAGLGWRGALACWVVLPALALLLWLRRVRSGSRQRGGYGRRRHVAPPWDSALAWYVTTFMGAQSLVFYGLVAWLPELLRADGLDATTAGLMLGLMQVASLVATIGVPVVAARRRTQTSLVVASSMLCAVGFAGLLGVAAELAALWAVLLGLGTGAWFSLALTLLILRSPDPEHTAALSGMAQSIGYAIAAIGPVGLGALHDLTASWGPPLIAFLAVTAIVWLAGLQAARDRVLGEAERPTAPTA